MQKQIFFFFLFISLTDLSCKGEDLLLKNQDKETIDSNNSDHQILPGGCIIEDEPDYDIDAPEEPEVKRTELPLWFKRWSLDFLEKHQDNKYIMWCAQKGTIGFSYGCDACDYVCEKYRVLKNYIKNKTSKIKICG